MTILEAYEKYKIMPNLAEHQLRVAAAASQILDNLSPSPSPYKERGNVVLACLLHDIGNIIKFDLSKTKNVLNVDLDLDYWQKVKDEFVKKYGADEHVASVAIARELGVSNRVLELVDCVGFSQAEGNLKSGDLGKQICAYADMRVNPGGVVGMEERFTDLRVRYNHRANEWGGHDKREVFEKSLREIEKQIFKNCKILPGDITEEKIRPIMLELKSFKVN
jgi:hypothetical protein